MTDDGATRVARALKERRGAGGVVPFIVGGHPWRDATPHAIEALAGAGASVIEVGIPFSDPIADGPVISEAMRRAIEGGASPASVLESVATARSRVEVPIMLMVSVSIVERVGRDRFSDLARAAGADGLIVPDLDLDDAPAMAARCRARGLCLAMLVAPSTSEGRCRRIVESCSGFVYLLARQGVTGSSAHVAGADGAGGDSAELARRVESLRSITSLPIACGFGISTRDQVERVLRHADAAIVGSAFVRAMDDAADATAAAAAASALLRRLVGAAPVRQ